MARNSGCERPTRTLSASQRRSVLRLAAVALGLALAVQVYYCLAAVVPAFAAVVPPIVAHAATAVGICIVLPATFVYAHVVEPDGTRTTAGGPEYGRNDRWERQNL